MQLHNAATIFFVDFLSIFAITSDIYDPITKYRSSVVGLWDYRCAMVATVIEQLFLWICIL